MGDLVHVGEFHTGLGQTIFDRPTGEIAAVLLTVEALLGCRRDQDAVGDQRRGGVVSLRHAVLALVESRPLPPLEGHGVFQAADADNIHPDSCARLTRRTARRREGPAGPRDRKCEACGASARAIGRRGEPILLALAAPTRQSATLVESDVPTHLRSLEIACGRAADYDQWLQGGER